MKPVTVSVVSHGQVGQVAELLNDLRLHCRGWIEKVVLTLNIPESLPFELDAFGFPVHLVQNARALGFGENHNRAFRHCETDWFLVLNPDVRLGEDVLAELLACSNARTALLAPQELSSEGAVVENLRGLVTPLELFRRQVLKRPSPPPVQNGWVKGMFMLLRASAYRSVHGFDERFFLYCEDFDLCARLIINGWTVEHHRDVEVKHAWQRSSHHSLQKLWLHIQSLLQMWCSGTYWKYRSLLARG
jgi:N-acetylglucosaminyl-diphospho-decaprenol L-rhamnosyltransferase